MTINFEDLSVAQLVELKQKCESMLQKRHTDEIKEALNKLFSAMDELERLDPYADVINDYDWNDLQNYIENNYTY